MYLLLGAFFLQSLVTNFNSLFENNIDVGDKKMDNIVLLLCCLYAFKVSKQLVPVY